MGNTDGLSSGITPWESLSERVNTSWREPSWLVMVSWVIRHRMRFSKTLCINAGDYQKPAVEAIRDKLTSEQYRVTQKSGTELPFANEFWNRFEKDNYVDVVTGDPESPNGVRYCIRHVLEAHVGECP